MTIKQFEVWAADFNPRAVTEPGKVRSVLVVQTDLLNSVSHPSTIICPITSKVQKRANVLRVHLKKGTANLYQECDVMIDQIRAIDNGRLIKKVGRLPSTLIKSVKDNLLIVLDL